MSNNNSSNTSSIVSKIWAFCNTLRDDGVAMAIMVVTGRDLSLRIQDSFNH